MKSACDRARLPPGPAIRFSALKPEIARRTRRPASVERAVASLQIYVRDGRAVVVMTNHMLLSFSIEQLENRDEMPDELM